MVLAVAPERRHGPYFKLQPHSTSDASVIADNSGAGEPPSGQPLALTGAGLSGRDGRRTGRARFIPVLAGGGACPVSGLDHGSAERLVSREVNVANAVDFRFSRRLSGKGGPQKTSAVA